MNTATGERGGSRELPQLIMTHQAAAMAMAGQQQQAMLPCKEAEAEFREAMVVLVRSLPGLPPAVSCGVAMLA